MKVTSSPQYWLIKSEPDAFSIDDLKRMRVSPWDGVRNYQARNFMKSMKKGDLAFFYHSSCTPAGIVGIAEVYEEAYPDHTSWNPESPYFDPKSTEEDPRWYMVDMAFKEKLPSLIPLSSLKKDPALSDMPLVKKGNRLSIMPVQAQQWHHILKKYGTR